MLMGAVINDIGSDSMKQIWKRYCIDATVLAFVPGDQIGQKMKRWKK